MNDLPGEEKQFPTEELPEKTDEMSGDSDVEQEAAESAETALVSAPGVAEETASDEPEPVAEEAGTSEKKPDEKKASTPKKKRKKKSAKRYALEFFIKIAITAAVVVILLVFVVGVHVNHGNASYPMIKDGDLVITYKLGKPDLGEEIAYRHDGELRFGRIVAKAGDEVEITDQCLKVNGYNVVEDVVYPTTAEGAVITFPYIVPEGAVFVLNDFRSDPEDSRTYGAIPRSDVEGEVIFIMRRRGI